MILRLQDIELLAEQLRLVNCDARRILSLTQNDNTDPQQRRYAQRLCNKLQFAAQEMGFLKVACQP